MKKTKYTVIQKTSKTFDSLNSIPGKFHYSGSFYGLNSTFTGKGVNISVIDTGEPDHADIAKIGDAVDVSEKAKDHKDRQGHATMVAGVIVSKNNKKIIGIAPNVKLSFAKVINKAGECSFNSLVAAILWSIVKKTDIILMSLGSKNDYSVLHDAVKKAYSQGIVIIAANENVKEPSYPANYPECLSVCLGKRKFRKKNTMSLSLPENPIYTTYLNNKYIHTTGSSMAAAVTAGLAALLIEKSAKSMRKSPPDEIYRQLSSLKYNA